MVTSATSVGRSGMHDWVLQRISAVVLAVYAVCVLSFIVINPELSFSDWKTYMGHTSMKVFTLMALLSVVLHAWIGLWTVSTDYLKSTSIRFLFQVVVILTCLALFAWGTLIVWGL